MDHIEKEPALVKKLRDSFREDIVDISVFRGDVTILIDRSAIKSICSFLKKDPEFDMNFLVDVLGVDYLPRVPRFEVVYHLYSISKKHRVRVKARVGENETVPSVTGIWAGADWPEREAYDMFGIVFDGHPNLKRIYLPQEWEGFPLRKDYPLRGYKDRYNPFGEEKE